MNVNDKSMFRITKDYDFKKFDEFVSFKNEIQHSSVNVYIYKNQLKKFIISALFFLSIMLVIFSYNIYCIVGVTMNIFSKQELLIHIVVSFVLSMLSTIFGSLYLMFSDFSGSLPFKYKEKIFFDTNWCSSNCSLILFQSLYFIDKKIDYDTLKKLHNLIIIKNNFSSYRVSFKYDADWFTKFSTEHNIKKTSLKKICAILLTLKNIDINKSFVKSNEEINIINKTFNFFFLGFATKSKFIFTLLIFIIAMSLLMFLFIL